MKIFLDANIIFSACKPDSAIASLVSILAKKHRLISCDYAVEEAERNLLRKQNEWHKSFKSVLKGIGVKKTITQKIPVQLADKDVVILSSAIFYKCKILITSDKRDFGHLICKTIQDTKILTPSMVYEEILS